MKRLFIIGASILQLPAIKKAKELGYYTAVADYNPAAVGIPYADEYYNASTIDEQAITDAARRFRPDGIMTLATDMPMRALARACAELSLPAISYETAVRATDKGEMIKAFEAHNVAHPWFVIVKDASQFEKARAEAAFPCVVKPTDNSGSRGVAVARSLDELQSAYEYARSVSRGGAVIIEEYLRGPEFSVEVMVVRGEAHVLQITDKLTTGEPHFVEMGHSQPGGDSAQDREAIKDLAVRAVKAVGIHTGPAHVEMILTEAGPKMVELGARMGGDCITTHLVPLSTGIDMVKATIDCACGNEPDITPKFTKGAAIRYFDTARGVISSISGTEEALAVPGVKEISFVKHAGERTDGIYSSSDRIGFVVAQSDTAPDAVRACERALSLIKIEISGENR